MTPARRLPAQLESCVLTTVRATGLPLRQREEVARELRAHFEDGLAAGRSVDELLRTFGDPIDAAGHIRAARTEGRTARTNAFKGMMTMTWREMTRELGRATRTLIREPGFSLVVIVTE